SPGLLLLAVGSVFLFESRRRAAQALHSQETAERERLKFIFEAVPVGISYPITRPDGTRERTINEPHLRLSGITREQADTPGAFARVTHPDDRERQAELYRQFEAGTIDRFTIDKRYVKPDGGVTWVMYFTQRRRTS